jgi:hypothetical protein
VSEEIELDYGYLTQRALRRVIRDALELTAELGEPPGRHHFYIEFNTRSRGVVMPAPLLAAYPERMTIVLEHQFDDLVVDADEFSVTLKFKNVPTRLTIPFEAVVGFVDPSVQFGLRFDQLTQDADLSAPGKPGAAPVRPAADDRSPPAPESAEIVSLDTFRKK